MKRKSILMTIVAVLFAGAVMGQEIPWPAAGSLPGDVKGADTIFFCARTDSLYPIELGYDVAGKRLHPSYGDWSWVSRTSSSVTADDYDLDVAKKNGGAGNAYRAVGSGRGGLLFEYKAKDAQCGLLKDEKFWVYVFVMPDENDLIQKDTFVCYATAGTVDISLPTAYQKYSDLYAKAGITYSWQNVANNPSYYPIKVKKDSIASYTFMDTLLIDLNSAPVGYTCGDTIVFKYNVRVDSTFTLNPISLFICPEDTVGTKGERSPNFFFDRNYGGTYLPATLESTGWTKVTKHVIDGSGNPKDIETAWKEFVYSGKDCKDKSYSVNDTLWITGPVGYWGMDTVTYCRDTSNLSLYKLWMHEDQIDYPNIGGKPAGLFVDGAPTGSNWYDRGVKAPYTPSTYDEGTTTGAKSLADGDYSVNQDIMKSNIGYHYLWRVNGVSCLVDPITGIPDSGIMVVILKDPALAQDYTAQLCRSSYGQFDLNLYTGLNVTWKQPASGGLASGLENGHIVDITNGNSGNGVYGGTYKYAYELPADCGTGGKGVFYLKVTDKIKTPSSKTVSYCINKLPASINVNDVLGVAVESLTWSIGTPVSAEIFNTGTGVLDVPAFINATNSSPQDIVFTVNNSGDLCGVANATTVTVKFVTSL
jgi:hypothetical protein